MLATPIGRLRLIGLIEGTSTLVLFFIAMPIKYIEALGANPTPVKIVGSLHGGLFLLYLAAVALTAIRPGLPGKLLALALPAAVVPFGPFVLDGMLKRHEQQLQQS
ncbi:MAG: DUF3817 domain-containing protein [Planctomycetota bacterium]